MIILGIDPGYAILGWGVIEKTGNHFRAIDYGAVTTDKDMEMPDRLEALYNGLREIVEEYRPEEASIEKLFFNTNTTTAINVGQARGVAILACVKGGLKVAEYTPSEIKQALVGRTVGENKFLSTSYNGFKNAPQNTKQIFDSRAVKINYNVKASTQAMMPGKGAGGDFGEIVLAPTNGKSNPGGKITDVRLTGQMVRRQGTQNFNQPRIEIDIEIG